MIYGDCSYWVAHFRVMTEEPARPAGPVEDTRKGLLARGGALVARLFARRRPPVGSPEERSR